MRFSSLVLLLAGCSLADSGPLESPSCSLLIGGSGFSAPGGASDFDDPGSPLTLESALSRAKSGALSVLLAESRAQEAQGRADVLAASKYPKLRLGLGRSNYEGLAQATDGVFLDVKRRSAAAGLGLILAYRPGEAVFRFAAASARAQAAESRTQAARLQVRFEVAATFLSLHAAEGEVTSSLSAVEHAQALENWVRERVAQGAALAADARRAGAFRAEAESRLAGAMEDRIKASVELGRLLRLPGPHPLAIQAPGPPRERFLLPLGEQLSQAAAVRPDLAAARKEVAAAAHATDAETWGWLLPTLELEALQGEFGPGFDDMEGRTLYGGTVSWDLGFDKAARARTALAKERSRSLEYRALADAVAAEVEAARAAVLAGEVIWKASAEEEDAARASLSVAEDRFQAGASLLVEVLDAQRALSEARVRNIRAEAGLHLARVALRISMGS